jgi:methyl-accepting chemotaxis protein
VLYGVFDTMGEISAASLEQSSNDAQVGEAVTKMDQTTQRNASLVEEMAAAGDGLKNQPQELVQASLPAVSKVKAPANNEDDSTSF